MNIKNVFDVYYNGEKNVFTDKIMDYKKIQFGEEILFIELSKGEGLFGTLLYGVSFLVGNSKTHEVQKIDLQKAFTEEAEARNYAKSIDVETFENADRFGEVKTINF